MLSLKSILEEATEQQKKFIIENQEADKLTLERDEELNQQLSERYRNVLSRSKNTSTK